MTECNFVFSLQEFLKIVPGVAIFPLSFYLAWKKLGVDVSVSFSVNNERTLPARITPIILHNNKDKPINIFAVYALIDKDIYFEIDKFDPPITIKALESFRVEPSPYSGLYLSNDYYEPDFIGANKIEIYIAIQNDVVLCRTENHPDSQFLSKFSSYRIASKYTKTFNDLVYNDNTVYAVVYRMNSKVHTAFIDSTGFIGRGWSYRYNMIPQEYMTSEDMSSVSFLTAISYRNYELSIALVFCLTCASSVTSTQPLTGQFSGSVITEFLLILLWVLAPYAGS